MMQNTTIHIEYKSVVVYINKEYEIYFLILLWFSFDLMYNKDIWFE